MSAKIIALAGKGGTGKTTTAALLVRYLVERGYTPVLAVDADPNANLNELLGLEVSVTIGDIREGMKRDTPDGMSKLDYMEMRLNEAIIEANGFDLIVMGQPQGPGCYCMANSILANVMERLSKSYKFMVVDNEAGMEHLSRLNLRQIHRLVVVSDASTRGIVAARRISELTTALEVTVGRKCLIVNRVPNHLPEELEKTIKDAVKDGSLILSGTIPESHDIFLLEANKKSLFELKDEVILEAYYKAFERILNN